jgi:RNA polymerase sigma-70 factor (ECF subfamily)
MPLSQIPISLIEKCRTEPDGSIEELITLVTPELYRIIFSMMQDYDDTNEVLQETLIRLFRHIKTLKDTNKFTSWVTRIAINQINSYHVRKNRVRLYEIDNNIETYNNSDVVAVGSVENPYNYILCEQIKAEIKRALVNLPEHQRIATTFYEINDLSIKEISEIMKCSEGAVKYNIHEGRKKLRQQLCYLVKDLNWKRATKCALQD